MNYAALALKTAKKINKYGVATVVKVEKLGAYDPATDSFATVTVNYNVKGLFVDYNARDIDGSLIQVSDRKLLLAVFDYITGDALPRLDEADTVEIVYSGSKLNIIGITPLLPAGWPPPLFYTVHVRG